MKKRIVIIKLRSIIIRNGKCLLLQCSDQGKNEGKWECPGGKPQAHESLVDSLVRETREETGLCIRLNKYFGTSVCRKDNRDIVSLYYLCQFRGRVKISKEHLKSVWVHPSEISKYLFTNDSHRELMLAWSIRTLNKRIHATQKD